VSEAPAAEVLAVREGAGVVKGEVVVPTGAGMEVEETELGFVADAPGFALFW